MERMGMGKDGKNEQKCALTAEFRCRALIMRLRGVPC